MTHTMQPEFLTTLFVGTIIAATIGFHKRFNARTVAQAPAILTTLGILATFVGVAWGLSDLKLSNVDLISSSIPQLLQSLQTAFWGSVFGVAGALSIKCRDYLYGHEIIEGGITHADEVSAADLLKSLHAIREGLVGSEDGTLISQVKLTRADTNERLDQLKAAQVAALDQLSQMSSKALVEALSEVIKDFNQKITEQFGDNFKELNLAVGKLLQWQDNYRATLEQTQAELTKTTDLLTKASADYAQVIHESGKFTEIATDLGKMIVHLDSEKKNLARVSEELGNLLKNASGSMPEIEKKIMAITDQLSSAMTGNQTALNSAIESSASKIKDMLADLNRGLLEANDQCGKQFTELADKARENVVLLDKALSEELNKSLSSLGSQLTALSQRFVQDYTPLTEKLRQLVNMTPR